MKNSIHRTFIEYSCGIAMVVVSLNACYTAEARKATAKQEETTLELYVSPKGNDANPGTRSKPFASLTGARDAIREIKAQSGTLKSPVTVWVRGGTYHLAESFSLDERDSGGLTTPIRYQAYKKEHPRFRGGQEIGGFQPVSDAVVLERLDPSARQAIVQTNLKAQGITNWGAIERYGMGRPIAPPPLELFFGGEPMTLARWPNEGWVETGPIVEEAAAKKEGESEEKFGVFTYNEDRPAHWKAANDVWLFGYWFYDWSDELLPVASIDTEKKQIHLGARHHYGIKEKKPYYVVNVLEELDAPGEYYLNRENGILYFWPPAALKGTEVCVSLLEQPLVDFKNVNYVALAGVSLEYSRGGGVKIEGGIDNRIQDCVIQNLGAQGVVVDGGREHSVSGCELYQLGHGGISLSGGDRAMLMPARHVAANNRIHRYSRIGQTYRGAVSLAGVGNTAMNNEIYDAPHTAIFFWGNEHRIERNLIHDVCTLTGDGGAIYTGRDWTARGNAIRHNILVRIRSTLRLWENCVYLDDLASGNTVDGNIFYDCHWGMLLGGGRDNTVTNNIFAKCKLGIHFDARGLGWYQQYLSDDETIMVRLREVPYQKPPWSTHYPELVNILTDDPATPKGNQITGNVFEGETWLDLDKKDIQEQYNTIENNTILKGDLGFVDADRFDFRLKPGSPLLNVPGYQQIPVGNIGISKKER